MQQSAGVDAEIAARALANAEWEAKVAIAQLRLGVSSTEARSRLAVAGGHLGRLLDEGG